MDADFERRMAVREATQKIGDEITELAGHLNAANHRFLTLIAEFDRREGWGGDGTVQSCAHWLNWKCGIALGAAREKVRVAHALSELPKISESMKQGKLSYSKVRALTRVACPTTENHLLMLAEHSTAQHVEKLVQSYRRAKEASELTREERQHANRSMTYFYDDDGSLIIRAHLPAEVGALFMKALDTVMGERSYVLPRDFHSVTAGTSEDKPTRAALRADAVGTIAESFLAHSSDSGSNSDKHQVVIHVDAQTLRHRTSGRCEIEHGPSMAAETARRLSCDASVIMMVENEEGEPLNVGRKTRVIPPAIRRALNARDQGCRFPGCCNTRYLDGHHIEHWANGGETKLSNLVQLCRFHHRGVHEGLIQVQVLDDGAIRFVKPNGASFDSIAPGHTQPISDWTQITATNSMDGVRINKDTAITRWCGERMDCGFAAGGILQREYRVRDLTVGVSAGTSRVT